MSDLADAPDPMIGLTIVGSYVIREKIAEGGMGSVYVATNDLGQKKVVKFLLADLSRNEVIRERFRREAIAAARLADKPHIVKIDDVGSLPDGRQFMTMEYLHGRTLQAHLRSNGKLTPHHALHIVAQIGRGLFELHRAGIVHRDLKPGNVFLTRTDDDPHHVKLIDLGIAHDATIDQVGFRTQAGTTMGTPGYMAPEQFGKAAEVTPTADLYALAVILWEMLADEMPWGIHDDRVLYFKQMSEPPTLAPGVAMPPTWEDTLRSALSPRPADRPQSIYQFLSALARALPSDDRLGVPSGIEIVTRVAGSVIRNAQVDDQTFRASGAARVLMWSAQARGASAHVELPLKVELPLRAPSASEPPPLGGGDIKMNPTTLSSSTGVTTPHATTAPSRRWTLAVACAIASVGIGLVSFKIVSALKPRLASVPPAIEDAAALTTAPRPAMPRPVPPSVIEDAASAIASTSVDASSSASRADAGPSTLSPRAAIDAGVALSLKAPIDALKQVPKMADATTTADAPGIRYEVVPDSGALVEESGSAQRCDESAKDALVRTANSIRAIAIGSGGSFALDVGRPDLVRVQRVVEGSGKTRAFWDLSADTTFAILVDAVRGDLEVAIMLHGTTTADRLEKACVERWRARLQAGSARQR